MLSRAWGLAFMNRCVEEEHMQWAQTLPHPGHKAMDIDAPEELMQALKFCCEKSPAEIDAHRREFLQFLDMIQEIIEPERVKWVAEEVAEPHRKFLTGIKVLLIRVCRNFTRSRM